GQEGAGELDGDVGANQVPWEFSPDGEGDGHGGGDVSAAHAADGIGGERHAHAPDDGNLPQAGLSAGEHGRMHGPASENDENKRAESFGEQDANQGRHAAYSTSGKCCQQSLPNAANGQKQPLEAKTARWYIAWFDFLPIVGLRGAAVGREELVVAG